MTQTMTSNPRMKNRLMAAAVMGRPAGATSPRVKRYAGTRQTTAATVEESPGPAELPAHRRRNAQEPLGPAVSPQEPGEHAQE